METLLKLCNQIAPLSPALTEYLENKLKRREVGKRTKLLDEGQTAKYIYFLEEGLVRGYYHDGNKEYTSWLMKEGDFFLSVQSFFFQEPSEEIVETLEDAVFQCLTYEELQFAYSEFREFNLHRAVILENYYAQSEKRHKMRTKPALERYKYLMDHHADLIGRVPDKYLASYLGVTPGTFSYEKGRFAKGIPIS
jgi:CRP/FNR family transcriptional regulator, anaerobic regulatory protein